MVNATVPRIDQEPVSTKAYQAIREFIYQEAGIDLGGAKQMLVSSRLNKRLRHYTLQTLDEYADLLKNPAAGEERQMAIDLLSTNETYFFREPGHFEHLRKEVLQSHSQDRTFRLWSAASSSGEEAYSLAMVLDDFFGRRTNWEIFGSDISRRIIQKANSGLYQTHRIDAIPKDYLSRYCRKGIGRYEGFLLVDSKLRDKTRFAEINLTRNLPDVGLFEVIFLRNVLIYFDDLTKETIVRNLISKLRPGGILYIGHSESIKGMNLPLTLIAPTTYRKQ